MNNPLEAVTQAVNSLVTALKLPDESAKANEVLGEMSFPQFSRLLPYRDYNQESGLFMNDTTMGFMLEAIPINGANESIVEALDHMLRTKLPRGIPLCIHLMSSQLVGDRIEYGLREFSWSGEQAERFNAITRAYYMKAAATQFPLPEGMNLPLTLRHYRVFISYCSPSKKKSRADILEMENLVKIIRASLQGASITTQTVDAQAFIDIVGEMINHNPDSLYPKRRQLDPYSDLNYQCVEDSFDLKVRADYLTLGLRENGRNSTARILNFHLARNPEIAFLWNVADNYSNLLNPELSISCPFILTLTLVVEDQVKTHSEANLKYMDLEKKSKTSYAKWFPSVEKEAKEWGELRQRLGSGQSSVVSYFLNITAFCKDNNETALEVEQDILNSFRKNGFELISPRFNHMRNFLTCLPFMAGKGLFKQLKEAGVVQRAESFNVANLMPLVADNPLTPAGLLAPTYRNQLAFIDIFFRGMNNTNYNMAVCGTSGAGKTGLIQPLIRSVLDSGGFAVVFDMGDGYKSLCENMGGVYLDGETLRFNPFANITDIDQSAERVRDQLSVMASPNGNLDEVHEGLLLQAVRASWLAKENRARIDDVVDFLKNASDSEQYVESPTIRSRLDEMIVLLDQYTANGTYGQYFNSDEPSLRDDAKMVVLELGGLEDRPSLLVAVMFSLIIYIENRMYRTPRNLKKLNVIDEGWRLLDFKNHKVGEFIEKGYRTARRHTGAYITITQNIVDFDSDKASSAARAAWGNSSYKIILKQSAKEFAKYNQLYPDQFLPLQRDMIGKFGAARGGQKMKRRLWLLMLFLFAGHVPAASADSACEGRFVNPITDICWSCIFPLSLGSIKVSQGKVSDTANPSMPIQICPAPPPLFRRIGLAIGYWEPMALTDVTRSPGCMVNLGFSLPAFGKTAQGTAKKDEKQVNGAFYHVHWYKYPLTYRDTYVTQSADKGTCQTYTDNPACTLVSHQCAFYSEEGACLHEYATYSCESKTSGKVMVCGGDVFCLDGECDKAQSGQSNDFAEAVSQLAALAAAGKDVAALNGVDVRAFTGQAKFCKKAAAGYSNCCKDSGWGQDIGLAKCSSDEKALAKAKSNKLTVSVGEFCSKKVLGVCLEKKRSYCQFDSKLAQIVQQQGRNGQLRISFGSAKHPDCRGITVDELQKIQFNRLDFTNFYEDLMNNQKIPDSGVLTQKVKEQIADQLKQAGQ
ncbi:TPA: type IV secretion system protein TraC [Escherichia coli]|nr:type IV secretion system protein TraC [Escherichia coli]